jgi:hypothetical protein
MSSINEFKLSGAGYIAKNGNSANAGTDPTLPKAHPSDSGMPTGTIIVGAGYYFGTITNTNRNWYGDGVVVFDFNNQIWTLSTNFNYKNIIYKNCLRIGTVETNFSTSNRNSHNNCVFINVEKFVFRTQQDFENKYLIFLTDIEIYAGETSPRNMLNSIFIGGMTQGVLPNLNFCFLNKNKKIIFTGTSTNFTNNCINGLIQIGGTDYELKFLADGSPRPDADPLIPDLATATGFSDTYTTRGNFAGDPKFLDVIGRIVDPTSDLLKRSNTNGYIGGVRPGRSTIILNNTDPNTEITLFQVEQVGNGYKVATGETWGQIDIIRKESNSVVELGVKNPITPLAFDSNETPGSSLNNNVPDSWPLNDPGTDPGKLPNRLTYLLRTSQNNNKPTTDGQWDNDASSGGVAGVFYVQEWFTKPTLTQTGGNTYGNAEPEGYGGTVNPINARWVHYRIYLRNDRDY